MAKLVVALPARNCADALPAWFASVARFADAVVALDDGSTDETADVLQSHWLTASILRNPVRNTYAGWDDAANRQQLLEACAALQPDWVLQLDADELLPDADADALRIAIDRGGLDPTHGYLLQVLRMVASTAPDGVERYDQDHLWVGRLFAWRPGLQLPRQRLHLVPLPDDIPPERWTRTTLRIRHYGSDTSERRRARLEKYREADPKGVWQSDYARLVDDVGVTEPLAERPPSLPVVRNGSWPAEDKDAAEHPAGEPMLTAIVISRDDEAVIERSVRAVVEQDVSAPFQVVVVVSGTDRTAAIVRSRFPDVELVELQRPALPGEARNAGLSRARGRYVTFPGSHIVLPPGSLEARLQCHLEGDAMVTGTTRNGTTTPAGWASYFVDHSGGLPGRPSHRMTVAPSHTSYLTEALRWVGGFPENMRTGEDTVVNNRLFDLGYGAWRGQAVTMIHYSPCRSIRVLLRHHYKRGQGYGTILRTDHDPRDGPLLSKRRLLNLGVRYVPRRVHRIHYYTWRYGERARWRWLLVSPLAVAAVVAAWAGTWRELLRPRPGLRAELLGDRTKRAAAR